MANVNSEQQSKDFLNTSLHDLLHFGEDIIEMICQRLNPPKVIPTDDRLSRDWRGLAVLLCFSAEQISCLTSDLNPTLSLFKKWTDIERCPVKKLILLLERLDRFDTVDDVAVLITLRGGLPLVNYHAFILYANEDVEFASTLVKKMEEEFSPPLKIFVKDRDLVVGAMDYNATIKLISERCNRMIVLLSPAFVQSPENSFFISFAQSIGINQRRRKIIPCILSECEIPTELKPLHTIDYRRPTGSLYNFWDKLYKSISTATIDSNVIPSLYTISEYGSAVDVVTTLNRNRSSSTLSLESPTILSDKSNKTKSKFFRRLIKTFPRSLRDHRKKEKFASTS